ncbi:hypothetical protein FO519_009532, partial [Halicephalobus sp. NKZ332]
SYPLRDSSVHIIAIGKAGLSMVKGAEEVLGDKVVGGIASVPFGSPQIESKVSFFPGAENNLPDRVASETAEKIENYISKLEKDDLVLFLISGGGSALLPAPIPGTSIEDKLNLTKALASNGTTIQELNTVRIALSRLKGGKLARLVKGKSISLIISDIVGDPIELIASGPTVPQESSKGRALEILERRCWSSVPKSVKEVLSTNPEIKEGKDPDVQNVIVLSNKFLVQSIVENFEEFRKKELPELKVKVEIRSTSFEGDATEAGRNFFDEISKEPSSSTLSIKIFAGETTVKFPSNLKNAKGGRNQELALAFLDRLVDGKLKSPPSFFSGILCVGTDGQDGPTDAAGAYCSDLDILGLSEDELKNLKCQTTSSLVSKKSYSFWNSFNSGKNHIKFGKTGHNLMDIYVVFQIRNE